MLFITSWLAKGLTSLLYSTLKVELRCKTDLFSDQKNGRLIALWHDQLLLAPLLSKITPLSNIAVVVSKSRDGRLLASYAKTYKNVEPILVGHKSRHSALLKMLEALEKKMIVLITPDGPRGPRHVVKPGVIFSAQNGAADIVAMRANVSAKWTLNTWDKMQIPKPFSKVTIDFDLLSSPNEEALASALSAPQS